MLAARKFIGAQQASGMIKPETDGGFGYGPVGTTEARASRSRQHARHARSHRAFAKARPRPNSPAARTSLESRDRFHQPLPESPEPQQSEWASDDAQNKGGFVYPAQQRRESRASQRKKALRSYGSMTCGGLLSFIYADLAKTTRASRPRSTGSEKLHARRKPRPGRQGLYYYHLAAKGLASAGIRRLRPDWPGRSTGRASSR